MVLYLSQALKKFDTHCFTWMWLRIHAYEPDTEIAISVSKKRFLKPNVWHAAIGNNGHTQIIDAYVRQPVLVN